MTDEELEAIEIDWTQGVAENFERVKSAALAAIEAANKRADELEDKIDGLESDLSSAIDVLFWHGDEAASEWIRLNYPKQYATFKKELANDTD
jgi:hypothetical protein